MKHALRTGIGISFAAVATGNAISGAALASAATEAAPPPAAACGAGVTLDSGVSIDANVEHIRTADIDAVCRVTKSEVVDRLADAASPGTTARFAVTRADGTVQPTDTPGVATAAVRGNIIHSSQTMQDVINIDIAKFRYAHDRIWNGTQTSYLGCDGEDYCWMTGTTSVSWNHAVSKEVQYYNGWSTWAYAAAKGEFHSDFLWCNFQPGQNFTMTSILQSGPDGQHSAQFRQNRACSGTHMSTGEKANTQRRAW